jgi:fumarate reductase subunit C
MAALRKSCYILIIKLTIDLIAGLTVVSPNSKIFRGFLAFVLTLRMRGGVSPEGLAG